MINNILTHEESNHDRDCGMIMIITIIQSQTEDDSDYQYDNDYQMTMIIK